MVKPDTARISVLLPCRNAAPFLPACIASLEGQSYGGFEVIAIDDGSTDETPAMLASWAARDSRVRVITSATHGLVNALNAGLEQANCEMIARMDADDIAESRRLEKQLRAFDDDADLVACGTHVRYFPRDNVRAGALRYENWLNSLITPADIERDIFVECPIAHPTLMIRRAALLAIGGYADRGWPEDYDLILRLYAGQATMRNIPQVLLGWRERPDRLSRSDSRYSEAAFRRCKAFYLLQTLVGRRPVVIWGAGPVGKAFARELTALGAALRAFVDVDPRKIGQIIYDVPVLSEQQARQYSSDVYFLAAVSGVHPRSEIRAALSAMNLKETADFIAVA